MAGQPPDRIALDALTWRENLAIEVLGRLLMVLTAPLGASLAGLFLNGLLHPH